MSLWLVALLLIAMTHRVTHLLTVDAFPPLEDGRAWIIDRWGAESWQAYLAECQWCVSVYVGAAVVWGAVAVGVHVPLPWALWAASSSACGLLSAVD